MKIDKLNKIKGNIIKLTIILIVMFLIGLIFIKLGNFKGM
jgi:hypothetical protein